MKPIKYNKWKKVNTAEQGMCQDSVLHTAKSAGIMENVTTLRQCIGSSLTGGSEEQSMKSARKMSHSQ